MSIQGIGKFIARNAFKPNPEGLVPYQLTHKAGLASLFGGIAVGGGIAGAEQFAEHGMGVGKRARAKQMGVTAYSGNIPELAYDGRANINKMTGQYDLGADGDIVLAMSANRKAAW